MEISFDDGAAEQFHRALTNYLGWNADVVTVDGDKLAAKLISSTRRWHGVLYGEFLVQPLDERYEPKGEPITVEIDHFHLYESDSAARR